MESIKGFFVAHMFKEVVFNQGSMLETHNTFSPVFSEHKLRDSDVFV